MNAIDQDQVLGILNNMKEAVRSDRNIDSRDSIELLHHIRSFGKAVSKGNLEDPCVAQVLKACNREESLRQFQPQLVSYLPEVRQLVQG